MRERFTYHDIMIPPVPHDISELQDLYEPVRGSIEESLSRFRSIWRTRDQEGMLKELHFCLLTPQSRATLCWDRVIRLCDDDLLLSGSREEVLARISDVRFKNNKAGYILLAREQFIDGKRIQLAERLEMFDDGLSAREWLVENVKGLGYKEASHFLRNIGLGEEIAILDRHILRNLVNYGYIDSVPGSISKKVYLDIEKRMRDLASDLSVPLSHLDLLLWYKEAGHIFK